MATLAFPYLVIHSHHAAGSLAATILDGAGGTTMYPLVRDTWAPQIAALNGNTLGGRGAYQSVVEDLELNVRGTSVTDALRNLHTLTRLIDRAERFEQYGEEVGSVLISYVPQGSTIGATANPFQARVLGYPPREGPVAVPPTFNRVGNITEISGVALRFERTGVWLLGTETVTAGGTSSSVVATAAWSTNATISSPLTVTALIGTSIFPTMTAGGFLLVAAGTTALGTIEYTASETAAGPAGTTTIVNNATLFATGGSVLRFTPASSTGTQFWSSLIAAPPTVMQYRNRNYSFFASVRNNNTATTWQMRLGVYGQADPIYTPPITIDNSGTLPRSVFLGNVAFPAANPAGSVGLEGVFVSVSVSSTAGNPTLDLDQIVILATDDETSGAVALTGATLQFQYAPGGGTTYLQVADNTLTRPEPSVTLSGTTVAMGTVHCSYQGNPSWSSAGSGQAQLTLLTAGSNWRLVNSNGTLARITPTFIRSPGYLIPE